MRAWNVPRARAEVRLSDLPVPEMTEGTMLVRVRAGGPERDRQRASGSDDGTDDPAPVPAGARRDAADVIDWLPVHQTGSYSAKDAPGLRPARLRAGRHWMLRRPRPPRRWSTLPGPPRSR
jgi:hypothetical protein